MKRLPVAAALVSALLLAGCGARSAEDQVNAEELARMEQACMAAMLKSACSVMSGPSVSASAEIVFVAGVGAIDAKTYRELRASGEAMCGLIRESCQKDWNGQQCRTARGLWAVAEAAPAGP
ncbi:hypothetical protein OOT46_24115 [Aquabacterium sp. A7-Y]|uniref:hypothetical protein n=1 Tax=Aquabacterium sp. A7-Y TaxID=1349605 RepID=UPI00223E1FE6|nr:hypothetical protein [Aquabacterium sp. A7-Y]MCW7540911.1 hypothetical protein [Aquabacterium sp. A7-Y]